MSTTLTKNFEPQAIEERWYQHWLDKAYFNSVPDNRKPYTVVIPPPNVTGVLHMGHTLNETVQDVLVRKARMSGLNACWVPGSDHASIATEAKVVQMLEEKGIRKADLSRQKFLEHAFEWKDKYGGIIYNQIRKLGCSVDWNRVTFTMDDHYYKAVIKVFVDLYRKGLIYRGARMINWDPSAKTALSDEEVEYRDVQGTLYYIKYMLAPVSAENEEHGAGAEDQYIVIATQRPETIMGDTAVCVHPGDERYARLRGRRVIVPLVNRAVPLVFDEYVDPAFGTGALKITPAHDVNDYNLGLKHGLDIIDTLNEDGTLSEAAQVFVGLDRFEARKRSVAQLRADGLLLREETYNTRLGVSQRTASVVEPRISTQWFVKMRKLADGALEAVESGAVKIHPEERFIATYRYWLEGVRDWCISRQLWWGQRIPAWYDEGGNVYVAESESAARAQWEQKRKDDSSAGDFKGVQDEDVLDTWFSSWLWPIEVFNGINEPDNEEIRYYYPTSVVVTGQDIIFFWVARMIMAGMEYRSEKPFEHVYFTGMVRDKQGRKMSKSLGNSPDLLELIDKFGADAVRFGILISAPAGNDLLFDESSCDQGRSFNNKIWNALKLVKIWESRQAAPEDTVALGTDAAGSFAMQWFEQRLNEVTAQVEKMYSEFRLSEALKTIYSLIWDDFCSWYLEWVKPGFEQHIAPATYQRTVRYFEDLMQLLHPFMPFVTEEIYHQLSNREDDLCVKQFESRNTGDTSVLRSGDLLKNVITAVRDARLKNGIKPKDGIDLMIQTSTPEVFAGIEPLLTKQLNIDTLTYVEAAPAKCITLIVDRDKLYLQTATPLETGAQKEQMQKDLAYYQGFLLSVEKKLSNERFVQNAKPEVVAIERNKQQDALEKIRALEAALQSL